MCGHAHHPCPKVPKSARNHNECYSPKPGVFSCLNRMDKYPDLFNQSLYKEEPLNLNQLNFTFTETHFQCQEIHWISWTSDGIIELYNTKSCHSNNGKKVGGYVLWNLLIRDMGFKGRKFIPPDFLEK